MAIKCKVKVKHGFKKIDKLVKELPKAVKTGIEEVLKNIQCEAIRIERGHNQEGIIVDRVELSTGEIKDRVYADPTKFMSNGKSYLWFEYFGTGEFAEKEHIGKTPYFKESGYTEWLIPVNKVVRNLNYPIVTYGEDQFYLAHGAKPNHFLQKAEFNKRQENIEVFNKNIEEMLKEVCK